MLNMSLCTCKTALSCLTTSFDFWSLCTGRITSKHVSMWSCEYMQTCLNPGWQEYTCWNTVKAASKVHCRVNAVVPSGILTEATKAYAAGVGMSLDDVVNYQSTHMIIQRCWPCLACFPCWACKFITVDTNVLNALLGCSTLMKSAGGGLCIYGGQAPFLCACGLQVGQTWGGGSSSSFSAFQWCQFHYRYHTQCRRWLPGKMKHTEIQFFGKCYAFSSHCSVQYGALARNCILEESCVLQEHQT